MTRIKNWHKFQHFKDRRPPWIKLYRDIMDDPEWFELSGDDAKALVMLWVLASEDEGRIPNIKKLAFRMRTTEAKVKQQLTRLSHWLEQDDIELISDGYQDDAPETERETQVETETDNSAVATATRTTETDFEEFWKAKPKRKGTNSRSNSLKSFKRAVKSGADPAEIVAAARKWADESADKLGTEYVSMAVTWLNGRCWEDYRPGPEDAAKSAELAADMARRGYEWSGEKWQQRQEVA